MFCIKHKAGYTLVEVLIASGVFTLFLGAAMGLFFYSQKSINKASWINNATRDESLALRRLSELAKTSSYPSTTLENVLKIADGGDTYKAKLPAGSGEIAVAANSSLDILAFPICSEQTSAANGTVRWASLWLEPSVYSGYSDLFLRVSPPVAYSPGAPAYVEGMTTGAYSNSLTIKEKHALLRNVEKTLINRVENSSDSVDLIFTLSFPENKNFKKEIKLSPTLNVLFED
jgi:type II secretory pathway pseudopilin PulG